MRYFWVCFLLFGFVLCTPMLEAQHLKVQRNQEFGSRAEDVVRAIDVHPSGVYLVGDTMGVVDSGSSSGDRDIFVVKHDIEGHVVWIHQFGSGRADFGRAIDVEEDTVVIGVEAGDAAFLRKYRLDGRTLWTAPIFGRASDKIHDIDIEGTSIFVAGEAASKDAAVWRFDEYGNEIWRDTFGDINLNDAARSIVSSDQGVFVCGTTDGAISGYKGIGGRDGFVRKYDFDGNPQWTLQLGTQGLDEFHGLALSLGGIHVVGGTEGAWADQTTAGSRDSLVLTLDFDGGLLWADQFGTSGEEECTSVSVDVSGLYTCGYTTGDLSEQAAAGGDDLFVRHYGFDGTEVATSQLGTAGDDRALSISTSNLAVHLGGTTNGTWPGESYAGSLDALLLGLEIAEGTENFVRGDLNGDQKVDLADAMGVFFFLILGEFTPDCLDAVDADDDGLLTIVDGIYLITFLYRAGPAPLVPFPFPGPDPSSDFILCDCVPGLSEGTRIWYLDSDGDGHGDANQALEACGHLPGYVLLDDDCDDTISEVRPGAPEFCNQRDDDCDGDIDESDADGAPTWFRDADEDGHGDPGTSVVSCAQPDGFAYTSDDCNDEDRDVRPGATEICNERDDDCDGEIDEIDDVDITDALTWYLDSDGDGHGDVNTTRLACSQPEGFVDLSDDCDDTVSTIFPGGVEVCNFEDDDCDGDIDEPDAADVSLWFRDFDEDGFGTVEDTVLYCFQPEGYVASLGDCDDTNAQVNPDAIEICNEIDDDCNGGVDIDSVDAPTWFRDFDEDGYGDTHDRVDSCQQPPGYVETDDDCDDGNFSIHPGGAEICNDTDDDCDGEADEPAELQFVAWYRDADGDGYGDPDRSIDECTQLVGYVLNSGDCDDTRSDVNPRMSEVCNGIDDDCNGEADEAGEVGAVAWYLDDDGDGFGSQDPADEIFACPLRPPGEPGEYVRQAGDCRDDDATINPGVEETCDDIDNNCDGIEDEGPPRDSFYYYRDDDGDGFGNPTSFTTACTSVPPIGFVANPDDCNDMAMAVNPLADDDNCDGVDDDCDGEADEHSPGPCP